MLPKRVVNVRFLAWLTAVVVVLVIGVYAVHAYNLRRNMDSLREEAQKEEENGHYARAANFYRLISGYAPEDTTLLKAYAESLDKTDPSPAVRRQVLSILEKILLKQLPEEEGQTLRQWLIEIAMEVRAYSRAREHLVVLLQQLYPDPDKIQAPNSRAARLEQNLAYCKAALDERTLTGKENPYNDFTADQLYRRAVKHDPRLLWSYDLYRVSYLLSHGPDEQAAADLDRAVRLALESPARDEELKTAVLVKVAQYYVFQGQDLNQARALLERTQKQFPGQANPYLLLAEIELHSNRLDKALETLRLGEDQVEDPNRNLLLYSEGTLLFDAGRLAQEKIDPRVDYLLEELRTHEATDHLLEELKARNLLRKAEYGPASTQLESVRASLPKESPRLFRVQTLLGLCYERLEMWDQALDMYAKARELRRSDPNAQVRYANALDDVGRSVEAFDQLEQLFQHQKTAGVPIARLLLKRSKKKAGGQQPALSSEDARRIGEYLDAAEKVPTLSAELAAEIMALRIEAAPQRIKAGAGDYRDYALLGSFLAAAAEKADSAARPQLTAEAEKNLRQAITLPGAEKSAQPWIALVQFLASRDKDKAEAVIQEMKTRVPPANLSLMQAFCYDAIQKYDRANQCYEAAVKAAPGDTTLRAIADFYSRRGQLAPAGDRTWILGQVLALAGKVDNVAAAQQLASIAMAVLQSATSPAAADLAKLASFLEAAHHKYPNSVWLPLHLANLRELQGDYPSAEKLYQQVLQRDPQNALALNNLAWLRAVYNGRPTEALGLINQAIQQAPLPEFLDTRAQILLQLKRPREAVEDLKAAIREKPRPVELFHLAQAQWQDHNRSEAVAALHKGQQEFGLNKTRLHPLEQRAYDELLKALKEN